MTFWAGIYIWGNYYSENPSIRQLEMRSDEMLDGFATLVENKDRNTGGHIKRTRAYVNLILGEMKDDRHYRDVMCKDYMENVSNAAPLHDIGKIATPDSILQKPGKLADVFDAVSQKRCYRDAMTLEDSFSIIEKGIGTDFDPNLAQIFLDHKDEVIKLMKQFQE